METTKKQKQGFKGIEAAGLVIIACFIVALMTRITTRCRVTCWVLSTKVVLSYRLSRHCC